MDKQSQHSVYLCLGTNLGDKQNNLERAAELIGDRCGRVLCRSGVYVSGSWGYESNNDFYNQCLRVDTVLDPGDLLKQIVEIEQVMGRERKGKGKGYADRSIDIDILFYDEVILETEHLVIPHPRISERMFVLKPMMELDPEFVHPAILEPIKVLVEKCNEHSDVGKL